MLPTNAAELCALPEDEWIARTVGPERGEPYGRALLAADADAELLVMSWAAGRPCAPHDHGSSRGLIRVLEGALVETHYRRGADGLVVSGRRELAAGQVVEVGLGEIHSMCARGPARTLHLYRPPIHAMRVWDLAARRLLVVDDAHGAFVPRDPRHIVDAQPWPSA